MIASVLADWDGHMMRGGDGGGMWWLWIPMMLLVVAAVVVVVIVAVRAAGHTHAPAPGPPQSGDDARTARVIAMERLARGEITAEEYDLLMQRLR